MSQVELRGRTVDFGHREGVPGLVRAVSASTPAAVAVVDGASELTYHDLELASDRVAEIVACRSPDPSIPVGVCLPSSVDLVVALLGVLKAGRCFVPLDPEEPAARRERMLATVSPAWVITEVSRTTAEEVRPLPPVPEDQPVYVLFTSGSTGAPKGVIVPSAALINRLRWMCEEYGFGPGDVFLQKTPVTFDVAMWELFAPLISGGRCVLAPPGAQRDPARLLDQIVQHAVTVCHFVPSMAEEFLRWPGAEQCTSVRLLFFSGESLSRGLVRRCADIVPFAGVHNLYGPTEAAIDVTAWACPQALGAEQPVMIGRPIANCVLVVLDSRGEPADEGELYVGGVPLALGYWGLDDRTAFVDAPAWCSAPRLYRTGDLVRRHADGLEFLGRADEQVKIRGHRVEPAEVEAAIGELAGVGEVAVVPVRFDGGDPHLVAFVVPGVPGLREQAATVLPSAFVPTLFIGLDRMPVTGHGKQDRATLTRWASQRLTTEPASSDDPVAVAWFRALRVPAGVDPTLSFRQAGGHSLAALRLVGEVRSRWGRHLDATEILTGDLSLDRLRSELFDAPLLDAVPSPRDPERAPLTRHQKSLWRGLRMADFLHINEYDVLVVAGRPDLSRLRAALTELVERHESLRTTIEVDAFDEPFQRIWPSVDVEVYHEEVDEALTTAVIQRFCMQRRQLVPSLDTLPLWSVSVLTSSRDDRWVLVVTIDMHMADQVSLEIFFTELEALYDGRGAQLPPLRGQLGDAAAAEYVDREKADSDLAYWRQTLAGTQDFFELPLEPTGIADPVAATGVLAELSSEDSSRVDRLVRSAGASPAAVFLTAFAGLLAARSGVPDLIVSPLMSTRDTIESQSLIGHFLTMMPVRIDGGRAVTDPLAALSDVDRALTEAITHSSSDLLDGDCDGLPAPPMFPWFNDHTTFALPGTFGGAPATVPAIPRTIVQIQFGLIVSRGDRGEYRLELGYPLRLFSEDTARGLLDDFLARLHAMLGALAAQRIPQLSLTLS